MKITPRSRKSGKGGRYILTLMLALAVAGASAQSLPAPGSGGSFQGGGGGFGGNSLMAPGSGGGFQPNPGPGPGPVPPPWGSPWNGPGVNVNINVGSPGWQNSGNVTVVGCGYDARGIWRSIPMRVYYQWNGVQYNVTVLSAWNPWSDMWIRGIDQPAYNTSYYSHGQTYNFYAPLATGTYYFNL